MKQQEFQETRDLVKESGGVTSGLIWSCFSFSSLFLSFRFSNHSGLVSRTSTFFPSFSTKSVKKKKKKKRKGGSGSSEQTRSPAAGRRQVGARAWRQRAHAPPCAPACSHAALTLLFRPQGCGSYTCAGALPQRPRRARNHGGPGSGAAVMLEPRYVPSGPAQC